MIEVRLDERSLARLAKVIEARAEVAVDKVAHESAILAARLMEETYPQVLQDAGLVAKPKVGRTKPRDIVKLSEAMEGSVEKTSRGYRAVLGMKGGLSEDSKAKVRTVFMEGHSRPHEIRAKNANWLTGWEHQGTQVFTKEVMHPGSRGHFSTLRLVRDRVYQRIRRGAV